MNKALTRSAVLGVTLCALVGLTACGRASDAPPVAQRKTAKDSAPAMTRVRTGVNYVCGADRPLTASYIGDSLAVVSYKGATHRLHRAISGSGARFTGDSVAWWIKGKDGTLSAGKEPQGAVIDRCSEQ